jgi:hypothetical protein
MTLHKYWITCLILLFAAVTQPAPNIEEVDASVSYHSSTVDAEVLHRLPVNRDLSGIIRLGPRENYNTNVQPGKRITSTSQFVDPDGELSILVRTDNSQPAIELCDLMNLEAICVEKGNSPLSASPGAKYGGNAIGGVVNFVTKSGSMEFSLSRQFNPNTGEFKSRRFANYYAPEKDFPIGAISSAGVSGDGSASFQVLNFPGNSFFFFRHNNNKFRPTGQFTKIALGNVGFISSGTLSNRIDNPNGPDYRFFAYRQYDGAAPQNLRSQVKLQVLNDDTFQFIGPAENFTPRIASRYPIEEQSQSVAIDPGGSFLAYTRYKSNVDLNLVYVRGISETGNPQRQKLITPAVTMRNTLFGANSLDAIRVPPDVFIEQE